ncbi:MAG TPA: hypothetical protein VGB97_02605 [Candidatus Paceibacterota bacterium]|jgi:tellurite resistance protein TehA-like permease
MDEPGPIDPFPTPQWFTLGSSSSGTGTGSLSVQSALPSVEHVLPGIFALVFFFWIAYTLVAAYHWFRYGHRSLLAIPLFVTHVVISGFLMLVTVAGLR